MMQLISLLKCKNNIKFLKFNYLMWTKVWLIIHFKRSGSVQRLVVRVPRQAIVLQRYWVSFSWRAWSTNF